MAKKQKVITPDPVPERFVSARDSENFRRVVKFGFTNHLRQHQKLAKEHGHFKQCKEGMKAIVSQTATLKLVPGALREVPIALPNEAEATKLVLPFTLWAIGAKGDVLCLVDGLAPSLTPAENVANGAVGVPSIVGSPVFKDGKCLAWLELDTDDFTGGGTKEYVGGDYVTVACDLSILGVALPTVTMRWDFV